MIPVVSIVGKSKSGKTTLICALIKELKNQGYKIATIKHDIHGFDIDKPGKDTWKHGEAGADAVVIASPYKMALIERLETERSIDDIVENKLDRDTDLILTEGYKKGPKPKIEIVRTQKDPEPLCGQEDKLLAFAAQNPGQIEKKAQRLGVPVYDWEDYTGLTNFILNQFQIKCR